ncbi:MAG: metalloregulator ArsR/SmtB family transcription factor [Oscillospiraceae bacterium]|nr:metalloregulator ArsR/SmtB family transcription factor [Oscillospiraceae bacterium]
MATVKIPKSSLPVQCDCEVIHGETVKKVRELMLPSNDFTALADLYKMFSDPTRVKILWALQMSEMCVCDLAVLLNMTKSAISHQLKSLRTTNLVKFRKEGKIVYYSLADDHVKLIFDNGLAHIGE